MAVERNVSLIVSCKNVNDSRRNMTRDEGIYFIREEAERFIWEDIIEYRKGGHSLMTSN